MNHLQHKPDGRTVAPVGWAAVILGVAAVVVGIWAVTSTWSPWVVGPIVLVCAPLAGLGIWAVLHLLAGRRLRPGYTVHPRPAVIVQSTPWPGCGLCDGAGGWTEPYADGDGEYAGEEDVRCECWTPWQHTVLPVPNWAADLIGRIRRRRHRRAGFSDEPPF